FFFSSRRRHTRSKRDWSSDVCSSDLGYVDSYWNPVAQADDITNRTTGQRVFGNAYTEFSFLDHFTFRSTFGTDLFRDKNYYFKQTQINSSSEGAQTYSQGSTLISENILTYSNDWRNHSLTLNGVYSYQQHTYEDLRVSGIGFPTDITGANNIGLLSNLNTPSSAKYSSKLIRSEEHTSELQSRFDL